MEADYLIDIDIYNYYSEEQKKLQPRTFISYFRDVIFIVAEILIPSQWSWNRNVDDDDDDDDNFNVNVY